LSKEAAVMASGKMVTFDKAEVVVEIKGKTFHIPHDKIQKIQFSSCTEKKFFKSVQSEQIEITAPFVGPSVVIPKDKAGADFDSYKEGFRTLAAKSHITLEDSTGK